MTDIERLTFFIEMWVWMPYIYFRKITQAHHEFTEELLTFPT